MPEGHSVARWAATLRAMVGEPLTAVQMPRRWGDRPAALVGERITDVETHGKHLLLHLSGGEAIHCHAMKYGSWQIGEPGMSLRRDAKHVRLRLRTASHEAVFFHGPVVELLTGAELAAHTTLETLGPDVLDDDFDRDEASRRVRAEGDREIGDTVLDQRVVAGLGNIFKSEALFLAGIDPRRAASSLPRAEVDRIWDVVIPIMRAATERVGPTTTLPADMAGDGARNWVYQRSRRPCLRCGTIIQSIAQGAHGRRTFFCPHCQR